jgi:hypothetical protein
MKNLKKIDEFFSFGQEESYFKPVEITNDDENKFDEPFSSEEEEDNDPLNQELLPGDLPSDDDCETCEHEEEDDTTYSFERPRKIDNFNDFFMSGDEDTSLVDGDDNYNPENDDDFGALRADGSDGLGSEEEEEEEEEEENWGDTNVRLERFSTFNEATAAQKKAREAFANRMKGKADKKSDDKKDDKKDSKEDKSDKKDSKGKTPKTEKEKKFAALAEPKDKITFADKIAGAKKKKEDKK